jgi:shikimate kinase
MGTGKTTVGRLLAAELGFEFVDMDHVLEARAGKTITRIFAEDGEPAFRAMERALSHELAQRQGLVVGTGGGVVLNPDNLRDFSATGLVVCLTAPPEVIFERTNQETHRPLLEQQDRLGRIRDLLEKRRALYAAIPHQFDTTALSPAQLARQILALYAAPLP